MIHSELCSAYGGPLQLGVGLVIIIKRSVKHSLNKLTCNYKNMHC